MIADGFPHVVQLDASHRFAETEYIVDYSAYAQHAQQYPLPFNYASFECSTHPTTIDGFNNFCSIGTHQPFYAPQTYTDPQCVSQIESEASGNSCSTNSPIVKAEDLSPEETAYRFDDTAPQQNESPNAYTESYFGTDVDTLMRAIQTKSLDNAPQTSQAGTRLFACDPEQHIKARHMGFEHTGFRTRRKYQCHILSCAKVFFQKTHLDIHVRSHTGHKPFVSIIHHISKTSTDESIPALQGAFVWATLLSARKS